MHARLAYVAAEDAILRRVLPPRQRCQNLCHRVEQLGPAAIKLGQLMATTPGLIGDPMMQDQLSSRLHDRVRPRPVAEVLPANQVAQLDELLGGLALDDMPVGSASIAQVHRARVGPSGRPVAVKVVRPHAARLIRTSFGSLHSTINLARRWLPSRDDQQAMHHTGLLLDDACAMVEAETNMAKEHQNMQLCHDIAARGSLVDVPRPMGHYLDGKVLVMELVASEPLALAQAQLTGSQRRELAQQVAAWWLECVVRHSVVHGDPHVGNWGLMPSGRLVLYDYGNIVRLNPDELRACLRLVEALSAMAVRLPGRGFFQQTAVGAGERFGVHILDWKVFEADVESVFSYLTTPGRLKIDKEAMKERRTVAARLSGSALRLVRSLLLIDGVCRGLDSDFAWKL